MESRPRQMLRLTIEPSGGEMAERLHRAAVRAAIRILGQASIEAGAHGKGEP